MLLKYFLEVDGVRHEIPTSCIRNWEDIKLSYSRTPDTGTVRSVTSEFEFVNEAYDLVLNLYLRDGINARAIMSLYTITERWEWEETYTSPIDFSTIQWDNYVLSVNCIDNELAGYIKANKSVKYEFQVGENIQTATPFELDRIPMTESLLYEVIGESNDTDSSVIVKVPCNGTYYLQVYEIENNVIFGDILYRDQDNKNGEFILKAEKDTIVRLDAKFALALPSMYRMGFYGTFYFTKIKANGQGIPIASIDFTHGYYGEVNNPTELFDTSFEWCALVKSTRTIWRYSKTDGWVDTGLSYDEYQNQELEIHKEVNLEVGDKIVMSFGSELWGSGTPSDGNVLFRILSQEIKFSWEAEGETIKINTVSPKTLCEEILSRVCLNTLDVTVDFSNYDSRISNTYLLAAESIRQIRGAKIYSSFKEFVDWMSTVFGYVYYLGEKEKSPYSATCDYAGPAIPEEIECDIISTGVDEVFFDGNGGYFIGYDCDNNRYYKKWLATERVLAWTEYNDVETGLPRKDRLFRAYTTGSYYVSTNDIILTEYPGNPERALRDTQTVYFVHRSEMYNEAANVRVIKNVSDVKYKLDYTSIYSSVQIGYERQDYEGFNGRDEFNFNNTYFTARSVRDKKLTLISKYRADCYGIEFVAQKIGQNTTDDSSDNDVFFVLTKKKGSVVIPDRSIKIKNTFSDKIFNGAFSPLACVRANAGYIGMQEKEMLLLFASSEGNSEVVIGGEPMNGDMVLDTPLMTLATLSFNTDELEGIDFNDMVVIESGGIIYKGYIKNVDLSYATNGSAEYELFVKSVEICY